MGTGRVPGVQNGSRGSGDTATRSTPKQGGSPSAVWGVWGPWGAGFVQGSRSSPPAGVFQLPNLWPLHTSLEGREARVVSSPHSWWPWPWPSCQACLGHLVPTPPLLQPHRALMGPWGGGRSSIQYLNTWENLGSCWYLQARRQLPGRARCQVPRAPPAALVTVRAVFLQRLPGQGCPSVHYALSTDPHTGWSWQMLCVDK